MRILVFSDTHGDFHSMYKVVKKHDDIKIIIHLGDGESQVEDLRMLYADKRIINVRGNCDFGSCAPISVFESIGGKRIFACHGHTFYVKHSYEMLVSEARAMGADIVLFGHTHRAVCEYRDGLYIMNPGSLSGYSGSYGIIDITPSGIITNIIKI